MVPKLCVSCARRRRLLPFPGHAHGRDDAVAVHVQARAALNDDVHHIPPLQTTGRAGSEGPPTTTLRFALKAAVGDSAGPRAILTIALAAARRCRRRPIRRRHSHPAAVAAARAAGATYHALQCLRERIDRQDGEAPRDGADAGAGAKDRTIDQPVRVIVPVVLRFDELERRQLGLMVMLVQAENGAVGCAEMAHPQEGSRACAEGSGDVGLGSSACRLRRGAGRCQRERDAPCDGAEHSGRSCKDAERSGRQRHGDGGRRTDARGRSSERAD